MGETGRPRWSAQTMFSVPYRRASLSGTDQAGIRSLTARHDRGCPAPVRSATSGGSGQVVELASLGSEDGCL